MRELEAQGKGGGKGGGDSMESGGKGFFAKGASVGCLDLCGGAPPEDEALDGRGAPPPAAGGESVLLSALRGGTSSIVLLVTSPTAALLAPFNMLKGFAEVFVNDYVNGELTSVRMGHQYVGYLSAIGVACGGVVALATGPLSNRYGRSWAMVGGHFFFSLLPLVDLIDWSLGRKDGILFCHYMLYGLGRGVERRPTAR